ncbi:hypothetical protein ACT6QG_07600 [Xanthobacter sp. TB0136]|uniref:hypothetical protein n=1 Tax=Xanthobacter sp. TB0136 TaxID=3459177 RepID=UPI004039F28A
MRKTIALFCVYALIGPPIGGLLLFITATIAMENLLSSPEWPSLLLMILLFSYLPGGPPAVLAGIVVCILRFCRGEVAFWQALLVGAGVALLHYLVEERAAVAGLILATTLLCWLLARWWRLL